MPRGASLTDAQKRFLVSSLACFETPTEAVKSFEKRFGRKIDRQLVHRYDPTKKAGEASLAEKWKALFWAARTSYLEDLEKIGVSHKATRLRTLERLAKKAESKKQYGLVARLLEQAAKEMGNVYTNKHGLQHTGNITVNLTGSDADL